MINAVVWGAIGFLHEAAPTAILHVTYRFGFHRHYSVAYLAWVSLLTAVYVLQARHIHWRYANFRAYVDRFNLRMQGEKLAPVAVPALTGWRVLLWLLVALPGIIFGAFWIIPAAITGSLQATYMLTVSRLTRKQLSARVYQLLAREHPDKHLPVPMHSRVFCPNPACRAEIPKDAAACPRCGRPVRPDSAATV